MKRMKRPTKQIRANILKKKLAPVAVPKSRKEVEEAIKKLLAPFIR